MLHINKNSKYLGYAQITVSDELPGGAAPVTPACPLHTARRFAGTP